MVTKSATVPSVRFYSALRAFPRRRQGSQVILLGLPRQLRCPWGSRALGTNNSGAFDGSWMLNTIGDYYVCRGAASDCDVLAIKQQGTG
jgi:hypothetical protein